jgi:putative aldouronate transport system substrate-binding protein
MKKTWLLKATLLVTLATLLLTSCAAPATQAPAQPTAAPTEPAKPAEPTATTAPAEPTFTPAAPSDAAAAQTGDWHKLDAYAPYPETVTVTVVKGGQENAGSLPAGDTIEKNKALDYLNKTLNIDVKYNWIVPSDSYSDKLNLAITGGDIPDLMVVTPIQLQQLVEADAIEDMTPFIDKYASPSVKANYAATKGVALESATIDGKIWGVPNVQPQADAPLMVWVRQDWLDKVGMKGPETVDDVEAIAKAFIEKDPGGNGAGNTIGLTGTQQPVFVPSNLHGFDVIFNAYGAFPTLLYKGADGKIVYGSVQPEAKEALARLAQMYKDGVIDPEFATKNTDKSNELVVGGKAGIMIGPWWIPWWPLNDSVKNDPNANWQPFLIKDKNGKYTYSMGDFTNSFVVVKKGYAHPEVALKIVSVEYDLGYGLNDAPNLYDNFNEIWTLLLPIPFLTEQPYVVERMGQDYQAALDGKISVDTFGNVSKTEFAQIQADIAAPRKDPAAWATRMARLDAALLLAKGYNEVRSDPKAVRFYSVDENWPSLKKMEAEAYLQIITGAQPIDYFDTFVKQWNESGGQALLDKMNQ